MENNYWYIGQKVSDQRYGDGIIINLKSFSDKRYPIIVKFEHSEFITYSIQGKENSNEPFPSLSQNPHVPLEYNEVNKIFKKGEVVWYCSSRGLWYLGIYDSLEGKTHKVNQGYKDGEVFSFEYLTDEEIKKFIELKV